MMTIIWILIGLLVLIASLFLRKKLIVFRIGNRSKDYISINGHLINVYENTSKQVRQQSITKVSLRKFKGCKRCKRVEDCNTLYVLENGNLVSLCNKELLYIFWCVPKTIYYA